MITVINVLGKHSCFISIDNCLLSIVSFAKKCVIPKINFITYEALFMKKYQQQAVKDQFCHCKKCDGILTKLDVAVVESLYPESKGYCMDCLTADVRDVEPFIKYFLRTFLQFFTPIFLIGELLFLFLAGIRHGTILFFSDLLANGNSMSVVGMVLDVALLILSLVGWGYSIVQLVKGSYFQSFVKVKYRDISTVSTSYSLDSNGNINEHNSEGIKRVYDQGDIAHNVFAGLFNFFLLLICAVIGPVLFLVLNIIYAVKCLKIRTSVQNFQSAKRMASQFAVQMEYCSDISTKSYDKQVVQLEKKYAQLTKKDREERMRNELLERHFFLIGENERFAVVGMFDRGFLPRILDFDGRFVYKLFFTVREKADGVREYKAFLAAINKGKYILYETESNAEISRQTINQFFPEYTDEYEETLLNALVSTEQKFKY